MLIRRVDEGEKLHLGLNWMSNEKTLISFKFVIPIGIIFPTEYSDFCSDTVSYGWRVRVVGFRFRLRRWKNFPQKTKKFLFNYSSWLWPFMNQRVISTKEMREDQSRGRVVKYLCNGSY